MFVKLKILGVFTITGFILILARFFYWQVIRSDDLSRLAGYQHERKTLQASYRGKILASDGSILVGQADSWILFAEPRYVDDPSKVSYILAPIISSDNGDKLAVTDEESRLKNILSDKDKYWVMLKTRLSTGKKEEIEELNIRGLGFDHDESRTYPESSASAHLLGILGKDDNGDNRGYFGLEGYYNETLSSSKGVERGEIDVKGVPILSGKRKRIPTFSGADLFTNIDKGIQFVAEDQLKKGIEKYGSISGSVIVMEPSSGGILAMASYPSFDPIKYWEYSNELFLNPVISASFEPGSVFKVITMASALDMGVVSPDTKCDDCDGPLTVGEYVIHTWNDKYYPDSSMTDVIVHSDNVGMVFTAGKIGIEKYFDYLKKFGLGSKTNIDLQGEMSPKIRNVGEWSEIDLSTSSFGQGIALTPIQLITAVNVIANKGVMVTPSVVKSIIIDGKIYEMQKKEEKRIISKDASEKITMMMVEAAKSGEAKWTYKKGFGVAGKTGTAQIPIAGHYDEEKTIASFIGFAPYDNPKFIMLVTLREPQSSPWASETAAPLWYDIAEKLFLHFGLLPEKNV